LYVFSILKLACILGGGLCKLFDSFSFSRTIYILPYIYYMNFWHVLFPLGYGPIYLDWMNKKK
jgi:hypothetical protein